MTATESDHIANDVKSVWEKITTYSEGAHLDLFISCYDDAPTFFHISGDGILRNYEEFKKICAEYYGALKEQKVITVRAEIHVVDANLVILGWTGNIVAQFKNGDTMKMNNYGITSLFKKMNSQWKVIHAHESASPPEMVKKA